MNVLKPRQSVPELTLDLVGGGSWTLNESPPDNFTMVVFYRGQHCPICKTYLQELNRLDGDFAGHGIEVIAASGDTAERAGQTVEDWGLDKLSVAYGVTVDQARAFGLHRSAGRGKTSIGIEEPAEFNEPGFFLVRPDGTLYWSNISTMPFARPHFREILKSIEFALERDYPARGELE
jgi:peroxiredoxin